jgi:hypothetical protein
MRIEQAIRRLARLLALGAAIAAASGVVLWWSTVGHRVGRPGSQAAAVVVVALVCLAPAAWLVNVRLALLGLLEIPDKLSGVTARRGAQLLGSPLTSSAQNGAVATGPVPEQRTGPTGWLPAARSLHAAFRDYSDVAGSWARLAQLLAPTFWFLTGLALLAVPLLVIAAAITGLVAAVS